MTYNPNIPQAADIISQSQAQLQTNFAQADLIFDVDHVTFDNATAADRGKHRKSTYIEQTVDPVTAGNELVLYSKDASGRTELFYRRETNGQVGELTIFKAWGVFNGSTAVIGDSFNIASVVRNAQGNYTVNFTVPMINANYAVLVSTQMTGAFNVGGIIGVDNRLVGSFNIFIRALTGAFGTDLNPVSFLVLQN